MKRRSLRERIYLVAKVYIVFTAFIFLGTDLVDTWVVPGASQPYGAYRTDFVRDIDQAVDIGRFEGALKPDNDTIQFGRWVGRSR